MRDEMGRRRPKNKTMTTSMNNDNGRGNISEDVSSDNDNIKEQNAFLRLIKPMIMDQIKVNIQECVKGHMNEVKGAISNVVSGELTLI